MRGHTLPKAPAPTDYSTPDPYKADLEHSAGASSDDGRQRNARQAIRFTTGRFRRVIDAPPFVRAGAKRVVYRSEDPDAWQERHLEQVGPSREERALRGPATAIARIVSGRSLSCAIDAVDRPDVTEDLDREDQQPPVSTTVHGNHFRFAYALRSKTRAAQIPANSAARLMNVAEFATSDQLSVANIALRRSRQGTRPADGAGRPPANRRLSAPGAGCDGSPVAFFHSLPS